MNDSDSVFSSFAFYPAEMNALARHLEELARAGISLRRARFLRALVHVTSEAEMLAAARKLAAGYADKTGPREADHIAARLAVPLLESDVEKLDRVKVQLLKRDIFPSANRAFVVRAIVRWSPGGTALVPAIRAFLDAFPKKPRGISKERLARKAKANG